MHYATSKRGRSGISPRSRTRLRHLHSCAGLLAALASVLLSPIIAGADAEAELIHELRGQLQLMQQQMERLERKIEEIEQNKQNGAAPSSAAAGGRTAQPAPTASAPSVA